jgi:hypothetical protein
MEDSTKSMKRITISIGDITMSRISSEAAATARSKAFVIRQIVKSHFHKLGGDQNGK